jgi:hypothetical protein
MRGTVIGSSLIAVGLQFAVPAVMTAAVRAEVVARGCWAPATLHAKAVGTASEWLTHEKREPQHVTVASPGWVQLNLAAGEHWQLAVEAPGCWSPPFEIVPDAQGTEVTIGVWPAGKITGAVQCPETEERALPELEAEIRPVIQPHTSTDQPTPPPGAAVCPVSGGRWSCVAPAGRVDVRIASPGYVPHYLWDLDVPSRGEKAVGTLTMARGASVAGWVSIASDDRLPTLVELIPESLEAGSPTAAQRLSMRALKTPANRRGFFQFGGVAAGSYAVVARRQGMSSARVAPVSVRGAEEVLLQRTVVLEPLASLSVQVRPALDPLGKPWGLELEKAVPLTNFVETVAKGKASALGDWTTSRLESGRYTVQVVDSTGYLSTTRIVDVAGDAGPVTIEFSLVPIEARVLCGDTQLRGMLKLSSKHGGRVLVRSDPEGVFKGTLPEPGQWEAQLACQDRPALLNLDTVDVQTPPAGEGVTRLELGGSGLEVAGRVVDEEGRPANKAMVRVYRKNTNVAEATASTDDAGSFSACVPEEGEILLRATLAGADSGFVPATVSREEKANKLELVLHSKRDLTIRVSSAGFGIPGALVRFFGSSFRLQGEKTTDADVLDVVALCPGYPTVLARVGIAAAGTQQVEIPMELPGGTLEIDTPNLRVWLSHGGAALDLGSLLLPFGVGGIRERDPNTGGIRFLAEIGMYRLCPTSLNSPECTSGIVSPGGVLTLKPPGSPTPPQKKDKGGGR